VRRNEEECVSWWSVRWWSLRWWMSTTSFLINIHKNEGEVINIHTNEGA
jgi:hypothetical protein